MRKGLKIKASFILLAWLVTFVHNAIPHHHINENVYGCHELIHGSTEGSNHSGRSFSFTGQPSDIKVCHLSGFLFHSFNPENLIIHLAKDFNFSPEVVRNELISYTGKSFIAQYHHGTISFRAPPMA